MNDRLKEQVSALVDNEVESASSNSLDQVLKSPELRQTWQRYHQLGDWMRGAADGKVVNVDVADRVRMALESEPAILIPVQSSVDSAEATSSSDVGANVVSGPRPWGQIAGIGIAAAVASLTVLLFQQNNFLGLDDQLPFLASSETTLHSVETDNSNVAAIVQTAESSQDSQADQLNSTTQPTQLSASFQEKLDAYLVSHVKQSATNGMQGMLPYARVVNHGTGASVKNSRIGRQGR
ncbi:MAG: sigma-E factor negative regulatory protein [Immundisolibacteraceae bacterium]|nr:sigma-E factor negative regulatory protein [Immundisolibacteraceae bacterium]